ncbi:hypothetical protein [Oceanobacillus salinisoli]|uniref:hypothetical protein n=1 Tax=Oceanobacillus salinisoli TaxID=2678611 RepID=UPI0012E1D68B|nr:hypothetical protein [Oceanobacillus salinisoli]
MGKLKNERGFALVLTLMIISLLLLFVLSLFTQITNTTKQITTMEKHINAGNIADMGVIYFQKLVETNKEELESMLNDGTFEQEDINSANDITEFVNHVLIPQVGNNGTIELDENHRFSINYAETNVDASNVITVHVTGEAYNQSDTAEGNIELIIE